MRKSGIAMIAIVAALLVGAASFWLFRPASTGSEYRAVSFEKEIIIDDIVIGVTDSMGAPGIISPFDDDTRYITLTIDEVGGAPNIGWYMISLPASWLTEPPQWKKLWNKINGTTDYGPREKYLTYDPQQRTVKFKMENDTVFVAVIRK